MPPVDWDVLHDIQYPEDGVADSQSDGSHIENAECIAETDRALLVKMPDGRRWATKAHIVEGSEIKHRGDKGTLVISGWLARKWSEEEPLQEEAGVAVDGVVCLQESAKAILVRLPDEREFWLPRTQLSDGNEIQGDGDSGRLVISAWIAGQKDIGQKGGK